MEFPSYIPCVISQSFCDSRGSAVFANRKKGEGKGRGKPYIFTAREEDSTEWGLQAPPGQADTCLPRSVAVSGPRQCDPSNSVPVEGLRARVLLPGTHYPANLLTLIPQAQ